MARKTKENSELRLKVSDSGGSNALYANLTYSQLEELLKRESVVVDQSTINLFDFLLIVGMLISKGDMTEKKEGFEKLELYKLIKFVYNENFYSFEYQFTQDGHNFYLKALLLNPSEIKT